MWLFTRYGFFSVVLARKIQVGRVTEEVDHDTVMIRARCRQHINALVARFPNLCDGEVLETRDTDYRFRMVVPRAAFAETVKVLVGEIDYTNFKSACAEASPNDGAYHEALHNVWEDHYAMQDI